jgi:hypothetical protein
MELGQIKMPEVEGDLDLADIDTNQPVPANWAPEQDDSVFDARDKDDDPNA